MAKAEKGQKKKTKKAEPESGAGQADWGEALKRALERKRAGGGAHGVPATHTPSPDAAAGGKLSRSAPVDVARAAPKTRNQGRGK
jgi:hypothetical protein